MSGPTWNKPLPQPTPASQPFWDGLKAHEVRLQRCEDCASWIFYPRLHCPHCASRKLAWRAVSGQGTLYTYTVARVPTLPEFSDEMPQLLAVIALDEGPHLNTTLVGVAPEALAVGQRMRPVFDERPGSVVLLRYTAEESAQAGVIAAPAGDAQAVQAAAAAEAEAARLAAEAARPVSCRDLDAMRALVGEQWSAWSNTFLVSQQLIDQFAALSGDDYWIHTDPVRAKAESPFGGTIAHGMLVQALASRLRMPLDYRITDAASMVNYGSDRLRFAAPVPAGSLIHGRCRVKAVAQAKSGVQMTLEIAIHVVGQERPALLNEQVILYL
jgi:acyl dehydratase/uncharacterized OB-fold protein